MNLKQNWKVSLPWFLSKDRASRKTVLFHRDYLRFQGGHLKVWHYFNHLQASSFYSPHIYFTARSINDVSNPWQNSQKLATWSPESADILFLAGLDWQAVLNNKKYLNKKHKIPVVNLIQGLSHADPNDIKYGFLSEKAIRICVSTQVSHAISATGKVNGPIFTIPNGVDLTSLPKPINQQQKDINILIVAIKKPTLGIELVQVLNTKYKSICTITELLPRNEFLKLVNRAKLVICLPHIAEGFYLPALEAMALGSIVICPDCIGNRSFCLDQENCFSPFYDIPSILAAVRQATELDASQRILILNKAQKQVSLHSIESEAEQFLAIMREIPTLW